MDLVVDLGLGRFRAPDAAPASVAPFLVALVASGATTLVREAIDDDELRVLEVAGDASAPSQRWLEGPEAAAILAGVQQHYRTHGAQIRFSPEEVQRLGAGALPELALSLDGPRGGDGIHELALAPGTIVRAIDLDTSLRAWTEKSKAVRRVASLIALAKKHRLIVHWR